MGERGHLEGNNYNSKFAIFCILIACIVLYISWSNSSLYYVYITARVHNVDNSNCRVSLEKHKTKHSYFSLMNNSLLWLWLKSHCMQIKA